MHRMSEVAAVAMRGTTVLAAVLLVAGCGGRHDALSQSGRSPTGPVATAADLEEVKAIAAEGFVYGLPMVMNYAVMYEYAIDRNSGQFKAPFNEIRNEARVYTYEDTSVVTPNSDTPYSLLFMDLRAEPIVLSVPAVEPSRYYSVMLCDGNTFNYGYIGSRTTGNGPGDYLVVGPGWTGAAPPGIRKVFRSSTWFSAAAYRTQLFDAGDMANVIRVQAGFRVQPLSAYLKRAAPPPAAAIEWPKIDADLARTRFFEYLDFLLQYAPAGPEEEAVRAKLARIGVGPGRALAFRDLPAAHKAAVLAGMKAGEDKIDDVAKNLGRRINGWNVASAFGDREFFDGNWLLRAAAAKAGIYGNDAAEAMYPATRSLANGTALDGAHHHYKLTFEKDLFPPVNAFWSVTIYDGRTQLLVRNPINRYLVNSPMVPGMKKNADGSLTIYIQKDSPGRERESNWLPAPDGPIYLVMRLYWPKPEPPSILPPGEGSWSPPPLALGD